MRLRNVIQLHTVNKMVAFVQPAAILAFAFAIVWSIGLLVTRQGDGVAQADMSAGMQWNGAIFSVLGPLVFFGFLAISENFPLATGLGLTRREFTLGTSLVFLANAAGYAVVITIGKMIEVATGGFGVGIRFFNVQYTGMGPAWQTLIQTFLLILAVLFLGAAITTAAKRWGATFVWGLSLLLLLAVGLLIAGAFASADFRFRLLEITMMGWWRWMGVALAVGLASAVAYFLLARRTEAR